MCLSTNYRTYKHVGMNIQFSSRVWEISKWNSFLPEELPQNYSGEYFQQNEAVSPAMIESVQLIPTVFETFSIWGESILASKGGPFCPYKKTYSPQWARSPSVKYCIAPLHSWNTNHNNSLSASTLPFTGLTVLL